MSGTISFPVTEQKYTNTGTKNVPRHVNLCANGQHKCWWWCGKATRAEPCAAFLVWELWLAAQPSPTGAEVPRSPVLVSAIPTYWSNLSVCQWTFMKSLVHQHCSCLGNGSYRKQFDETSQIWRQKILKSGRFNWIFLLHIFGTFIIPPPSRNLIT